MNQPLITAFALVATLAISFSVKAEQSNQVQRHLETNQLCRDIKHSDYTDRGNCITFLISPSAGATFQRH